MSERLEAIVIGSGFGGSISACRLSKKWPGKVMLLERGKRYPMGSFPRSPHDLSLNFWNVAEEKRRRPRKVRKGELHGMFDIRRGHHMDVVLCAGLGGGSLIYANVFLMPPDQVFDHRWPASCKRQSLMPYYQVAKVVLGARRIPLNGDPHRRIRRTQLFEQSAGKMDRKSFLLDINVFFGKDFSNPLAIGLQDKNDYGAVQTSCTYCGECDIGCNYHAKNTLDLNYLFVAENRYNTRILTECLAEKIVPIDEQENDNPDASGSSGYRVYYRNLASKDRAIQSIVAKRVILSAGTLGTSELLLRAKHRHNSLTRLSPCLGQNFSGNGDFLSFVMGSREPADPNYGPVITQAIDHNLFEDFQPDRAFVMEDASYPNLGAWFVEGFRPPATRLESLCLALKHFRKALRLGITSMGRVFSDLLSQDLSYNTCVLLCMGLDKSNGVLALDKDGYVDVDWPYKDSMALYDAILNAGRRFQYAVGGKHFFPLPTWTNWLFQHWRRNITVHPLGGCILANTPSEGVTSAEDGNFGQVFGYPGLYIADGSIVPTAVGANPTAVISALAERVAEGITRIRPDAEL